MLIHFLTVHCFIQCFSSFEMWHLRSSTPLLIRWSLHPMPSQLHEMEEEISFISDPGSSNSSLFHTLLNSYILFIHCWILTLHWVAYILFLFPPCFFAYLLHSFSMSCFFLYITTQSEREKSELRKGEGKIFQQKEKMWR